MQKFVLETMTKRTLDKYNSLTCFTWRCQEVRDPTPWSTVF